MSDRSLPASSRDLQARDEPPNMLRVRVGRVVEVRITGWGLLAAAFIAMFPVAAGIWAGQQRWRAARKQPAVNDAAPETVGVEPPSDHGRAANRA